MKIIIPIIMGGIIGYFTNWLAIRMLFRPYEEKYIFGFKVPFTPGLIPKEQERIAENVGRTVEEYLLSPESIMKFIDEEDIEKKVLKNIDKSFEAIKNKSIKLKQLLVKFFDDYDLIRERMKNKLEELLVKELRTEKVKINIKKSLKDKFNDVETQKDISLYLDKMIRELIKKEEFKSEVIKILSGGRESILEDERKLNQVLTEECKDGLFSFIDKNKNVISNRVRNFISIKEVEYKIKNTISEIVEQNVSKLITTFISLDVITEKVYVGIENYIKSDKATEDISQVMNFALEDLLNEKVNKLGSEIIYNLDTDYIGNSVYEYILSKLENINIIDGVNNLLKNYDEEIILNKIIASYEEFTYSNGFKKVLSNLINSGISNIEEKELDNVLIDLNLGPIKIAKLLKKVYNNRIEPRLAEIIKSFNIGDIVKNSIKEFEFDFVEKLILDIADKELKAITMLGGLIGAIIGLFTPLIQLI